MPKLHFKLLDRLLAGRAVLVKRLVALALACMATSAVADGGPLGIDSTVGGNASGIFSRSNQILLQDLTPLVVVGAALWEGDGTRYGHTSWQSVDSLAAGAVAAAGMKLIFSRSRFD